MIRLGLPAGARSSSRPAALLCALLALGATPALAQDLALRAGKLVVEAGQEPIDGGLVLIRAGKVVAAGKDVKVPDGVQIVERPQAWVVPGFVDARAHLGLRRDLDERAEPFARDVDLARRLVPHHRDFARHLATGVTTALVSPGDRAILGGAAVPVKTTCTVIGEARVAKLSLTSSAAAAGPPTSLAGRLALLRRTLRDAHGAEEAGGLLEAFARGEVPALVTVDDLNAFRALRRLSPRYGLQLTYDLRQAYYGSELEGLDLDGARIALPPSGVEAPLARRRFAATLQARGAQVLFVSDAPFDPSGALRLSAAQAAAAGLDGNEALAGLTTYPAAALGLEGVVGSLQPGCHGDLVVLSGPPLDLRSRVQEVYVEGRQVHRAGGEE